MHLPTTRVATSLVPIGIGSTEAITRVAKVATSESGIGGIEGSSITIEALVGIGSGLVAANLSVAHLATVGALDTRIVTRLGTLARNVALGIAVAADDLLLLGAVLGTVALLAAIVACTATNTLRAVSGEVALLTTLSALDIFHVGGLGALLGLVAGLTTVLASELVDARLGTWWGY
jgi:hypothetical protein